MLKNTIQNETKKIFIIILLFNTIISFALEKIMTQKFTISRTIKINLK